MNLYRLGPRSNHESSMPGFHKLIDQLPTPEIKIANAEVGPMRNLEGVRQGRVQAEIDIVEDSWHSKVSEFRNLPLLIFIWNPSPKRRKVNPSIYHKFEASSVTVELCWEFRNRLSRLKRRCCSLSQARL